jgi:hypothetical protein
VTGRLLLRECPAMRARHRLCPAHGAAPATASAGGPSGTSHAAGAAGHAIHLPDAIRWEGDEGAVQPGWWIDATAVLGQGARRPSRSEAANDRAGADDGCDHLIDGTLPPGVA